jgi:hypothetical protein
MTHNFKGSMSSDSCWLRITLSVLQAKSPPNNRLHTDPALHASVTDVLGSRGFCLVVGFNRHPRRAGETDVGARVYAGSVRKVITRQAYHTKPEFE